jgi:hypothetical protein
MSTPTQKTPGNREKIGPSVTTVPPIVPAAAEDDYYPGGRIGMMLWVSAVVLLAGYLLWDLVTALLFR